MKKAAKPKIAEPIEPSLDDAKEAVANALTIVKKQEKKLAQAIENPQELEAAVRQWASLREIGAQIAQTKAEILDPLTVAKKNIKKSEDRIKVLFVEFERRNLAAINVVKSAIEDYNAIQEKLLDERRERLQEKVDAGKISEAEAARRITKRAGSTGIADVPTTTTYVMEIENEDEVPAKYWIIDEPALREAAIKLFKDEDKQIPGVRVEKRKVLVKR